MKTKYNSGRITDIISYLINAYSVSSISKLPTHIKLQALCEVLQLTPNQLDALIIEYSNVLRTIQGHTFESVFEHLILESGYEFVPAGGDTNIDGLVNNYTLQLKTPYNQGTRGQTVAYKSHKTHGAKSEAESMEYYSRSDHFPDYMVGLISYSPLRIIFISRDELPRHPLDPNRILSPFSLQWDTHPGLNAFTRIGIENLDTSLIALVLPSASGELLPRTASALQVRTDIILNTILKTTNFRIWDMNVRGVAREVYLFSSLREKGVILYKPISIRPGRGDKADLTLQSKADLAYKFFQIKGVSFRGCRFRGVNSTVDVETQLTRGHVNDHETQSRLYMASDFDYLIVGLDPAVAELYKLEVGLPPSLNWEYYVIPTEVLTRHPKYPNHIKSHQYFNYLELQQYRLNSDWADLWSTDDHTLK